MLKDKSDSLVTFKITFDSFSPDADRVWRATADFLVSVMGEDGARQAMQKAHDELKRRLANPKARRRTISVRQEKRDADSA